MRSASSSPVSGQEVRKFNSDGNGFNFSAGGPMPTTGFAFSSGISGRPMPRTPPTLPVLRATCSASNSPVSGREVRRIQQMNVTPTGRGGLTAVASPCCFYSLLVHRLQPILRPPTGCQRHTRQTTLAAMARRPGLATIPTGTGSFSLLAPLATAVPRRRCLCYKPRVLGAILLYLDGRFANFNSCM